jgi:hypothetical protein
MSLIPASESSSSIDPEQNDKSSSESFNTHVNIQFTIALAVPAGKFY